MRNPNEPQDDSDVPEWARDLTPQPRRNPELPRPARAPQPRVISRLGQFAIDTFGADYLEISFLLKLLRPPICADWIHDAHKNGWSSPSTKSFISYQGARIVIANRIAELGLSPELVYAAPHNVPQGDWREQHEEWKRFNRLPFEKQMDEFR